MKSFSPKQWIFVSAGILLLGSATWAAWSLRDDDSGLSVLVRYTAWRMGWAADSSTVEVLTRIARYSKRGRYDDLIRAGTAWTEAHPPNDYFGSVIYQDIAWAYLAKAKADAAHSEEDVNQAMLYRDKAVPLSLQAILGLEYLADLSEEAGDLSARQRCVQYGNAIKLLDRIPALGREQSQEEPGRVSAGDLKSLQNQVDARMSRIRAKLRRTCSASAA